MTVPSPSFLQNAKFKFTPENLLEYKTDIVWSWACGLRSPPDWLPPQSRKPQLPLGMHYSENVVRGSKQPLVRDESEHNNLLVDLHQQDFQSASQYRNSTAPRQLYLSHDPAVHSGFAYKVPSIPSHLHSVLRLKPHFHCALCTSCSLCILTEISSSEPSLV